MSREEHAADAAANERAEALTMHEIASETAEDARRYVTTVTELASGNSPESVLSLLLLALSDVLGTGARLGAMIDVVPDERFEPDPGPDPDLDPLRTGLANLLEGLDEYAEVADPLVSAEVTQSSLVNDVCTVAGSLIQGLGHYDAGGTAEALWWWQFSYLSSWGERAAAAVRVVHSILAHLRLDADADVVAEAEFEALHG